MNMISRDVQVILAFYPTVQGNDWIDRITRYGFPNHHWFNSVLHCSWEARSQGCKPHVAEYHLLPLVCRPAVAISTSLQSLLNVDSEKYKFPDVGSYMISSFIELTANSFDRNWTIQMLFQLSSSFVGRSPMLSSHNAIWYVVGLCR